jgi:MerR family transcriptional regulator/heat shock protein HspR
MKRKNLLKEMTAEDRKDMPLYTIGVVAELMGVAEQTLRLYEKHGLIKPVRKNGNRFYSDNDINWLQCLRDLLHVQKISIEGIKKLLNYAPCWEIKKCSKEKRDSCSAYMDRTTPCWELNRVTCDRELGKICEECIVFLFKSAKKQDL